MTVPYSFANATVSIPLSQLDSNFNTPITLGNTAIQLGNTVTTLNNMTLANVTISSGNVTITNVSVTTANVTTLNATTVIATTANVTTANITTGNVTTANIVTANITTGNVTNMSSGNVTITGGSINGTTLGATTASTANVTTLTTSSTVTINGGTANGVAYLNGSKVLTTGSALSFDGTVLTNAQSSATNGVLANFQNTTTNSLVQFSVPGVANVRLGAPNADAIAFYTFGSGSYPEQMRLTSTGLGIGTSSPAYRLDVQGSSSPTIRVRNTSAVVSNFSQLLLETANTFSGLGNAYLRAISMNAGNSSTALAFGVNADGGGAPYEAMRLDQSGNLGLGVTPSAWATSYKAFQFSANGVLYNSGANNYFGSNTYYDGSANRYITTAAAGLFGSEGNTFKWYTAPSGTAGNPISFTQAMTLDASGRLGIGTTSPDEVLVVKTSAGNVKSSAFNSGAKWVGTNAANNAEAEFGLQGNPLVFLTNGTQRARITSGGQLLVGTTTGTLSLSRFAWATNARTVEIENTNASLTTDAQLFLYTERNTTNNTYYYFGCYNGTAGAWKLRIADSGDVTNTNGTYGTISDAKMKTDIVDAGSQWADIKAIRFRKFKMKDDPSGLVQLGVVAQELEQISPGLVDEHTDRDKEGNDLGTTTKSVKTSVLLMKAAVALQEAMARIEQLEAKVAALEAK